ncbi:PEPxxWA-CTERM sorting domain-containing protein [Rugamonas sp. CCM 8940]|uniref:PEPxxWA-CTERM sorting domain-containing protein n=1 Tax=Rugamonas sp. CCM 8940 TaxID=2765359 RepID=UPI001F2A02F4|nr:PEPxxWA-CTERM sorting domain-containing protein [Rugamonas sp. CCM 8940]
MKFVALLSSLLFAAGAQAAPTLLGDTVDAGMYRTVDTGHGVGRINGFGLDAPFVVQAGTADLQHYSVAYSLNVEGDKFLIDFLHPSQWGSGIVFRLSGLDFSPAGGHLSSLTVDSNLSGYTLKVGKDYVEIGLAGVKGTADSYFTGSFNVSAVPEPSSWAMLALGLGALGAAARRQKRKIGTV